jgi:hypothetical protein
VRIGPAPTLGAPKAGAAGVCGGADDAAEGTPCIVAGRAAGFASCLGRFAVMVMLGRTVSAGRAAVLDPGEAGVAGGGALSGAGDWASLHCGRQKKDASAHAGQRNTLDISRPCNLRAQTPRLKTSASFSKSDKIP